MSPNQIGWDDLLFSVWVFSFLIINFYLFIYFSVLGLHCFTVGLLSRCSEQGATLLRLCQDFSLGWLLLLWSMGPGARGLQELQLAGSRAQVQQLCHTGLVAPWLMRSSQTRDRTCVSFTGRQILYHWVTSKALHLTLAAAAAAAAKSLQSCPTLCNPLDGSPQRLYRGILLYIFLHF